MATPENHLLPAPHPAGDGSDDPTKLVIGAESGIKLDQLGPMVVNSDGTLSRIANWPNMTPTERERTMRVLVARNKIRIANQETKLHESTPAT